MPASARMNMVRHPLDPNPTVSMLLLKLSVLPIAAAFLSIAPLATSSKSAAGVLVSAPVHCQVPCGVYGDSMRISMLMEDAITIEKGMKKLIEMDGQENPSKNQMVRWVMNKDEHAAAIQDQVASYWLAQRIKAPKDASDKAARARYLGQLELMHGITVAAMKCKQTTDVANVAKLRSLGMAFAETYFSKEDLAHIKSHGEGH
ncbi:MAG: nickel superoxide dismutase [Planctomycetota bacterium]|jgi:nickel superoxide dismutase